MWFAGRRISLPAVGRALYSLSCQKLEEAGTIATISRTLPLLLQAGCLGETRALYMSSVLYSAELGVRKQSRKVRLIRPCQLQSNCMERFSVFSFTSSPVIVCDSGLASGPAGSPERWSISTPATWTHAPPRCPRPSCGSRPGVCILCKYCSTDNFRSSESQLRSGNKCMNVMCMCLTQYCYCFSFLFKTFVEAIYLNDDETLNQQTNEKHHIFQWLRLQARQGAAEAEVPRNMGRG